MSRRFHSAALVAILCCAAGTLPARAICKSARLIDFQTSIYTPGYPLGSGHMGSTISPGFRGGFWALAAGDPRLELGIDSGTWEALDDGWVYAEPGYPAGGTRPGVSLTWAGSPEIDGCIDFAPGARCMALLLMDQNSTGGQFWLGTDEPDHLLNYDLAPEGAAAAVDLIPIPPPMLLDQPPFGAVFEGPRLDQIAPGLDLEANCAQDMVVGFRTYRWFGAAPPTDFTRDDGVFGVGWELHPDSVGPGGEPAPLGGTLNLEPFCPTGSAVYYAVSLVLESGFETDYLSGPSPVIDCDCSEDADGDGFCGDPGSELRDCDDTDAAVYPGAPQVCDDVNNDCLDPAWPAMPANEVDDDGDGFSVCGGDCSDADPSVYPGAPEVCDGRSNDCDAPGWPNPPASDADVDGDGFAPCDGDCSEGNNRVYPGAPQVCDGLNNDCNHPDWPLVGATEVDVDGDGLSECLGDCDEDDATVYAGAPQLCGDGKNNDCLSPTWPQLAGTNETDIDGDGFSGCAGDCDDQQAVVYPGAPEVCDGVNNDCNDPDWPAVPDEQADNDGDGLAACAGDCDDARSSVYPGAPEICDGLNNDCNDPDWPAVAGDDVDADGDGFAICAGDCDDFGATTFPGAPQLCDGVNNDCLDPDWPSPPLLEIDQDDDGIAACAGDCRDTDATTYPGAPPLCDGVNHDCDDPIWPTPHDDQVDRDGDGLAICAGDCDDASATTYPGAPQLCDGRNNDCDDPSWPAVAADEADADGDTFAICAGDCDDSGATTFPGAPQLCDGVNNDCDDQGWPAPPADESDADGDGFAACAGDCVDADAGIFPGAVDACDGLDNDCDGTTDEGVPEVCDNGVDDDCDSLVDDEDLADCDPLSVSLESFTATWTRGSVLIRWATSAEVDTVGFRIVRQRPGGKTATVTTGLIPAAGGELRGASYRYIDAADQRAGAVSYFLEDIDRQGQATRHGPAVVVIPEKQR